MDIIILGLIAIFSAGIIVWIYAVLVDRHYREEQSDADRLSDKMKANKKD